MSAYQETKVHGTHDFPFAVYRGLVPDWLSDFPLHWHEEMEIIYVEKGCVSISVRNTEYLVKSGELVLIHPQMIHSIRQHEEDRGFYHNILFRFSMLESGIDALTVYMDRAFAAAQAERQPSVSLRCSDSYERVCPRSRLVSP